MYGVLLMQTSGTIPKELSAFLKGLKTSGNTAISGEGSDFIKRIFSDKGAQLMTVDFLRQLEAFEEIEDWFIRIKAYIAD